MNVSDKYKEKKGGRREKKDNRVIIKSETKEEATRRKWGVERDNKKEKERDRMTEMSTVTNQ